MSKITPTPASPTAKQGPRRGRSQIPLAKDRTGAGRCEAPALSQSDASEPAFQIPPDISAILPMTSLSPDDDVATCRATLEDLARDLRPRDPLGWTLVYEIAEAILETARLRRALAVLIGLRRNEAIRSMLSLTHADGALSSEEEDRLERVGVDQPTAAQAFQDAVAPLGLSLAHIDAVAFGAAIDIIDDLHAGIAELESRRRGLLADFERHQIRLDRRVCDGGASPPRRRGQSNRRSQK